MNSYDHRQFASPLMLALLVGLLAFLLYAAWQFPHPVFLVCFAIVGAVALFFHSLTVVIDREYIRLRFGIGWIRFKFRISDVIQLRIVRNRWWYGWGIRLTPHGWLYNINGLDAIEIRMRNGKTFRIGADDPGALLRSLEQAAHGVK